LVIAVVLAAAIGFVAGRSERAEPKRKGLPVSVKRQKLPGPAEKQALLLPSIQKKFPSPRIAIVMDDFGYNAAEMNSFFGIGEPITLSILPDQSYSVKIASMAHSKGYEVILHLPLEPKSADVKEEPDTIRSSMSDGEISSRLKKELASVPYLSGISNHMGSKATEDKRVMSIIMAELKRQGIFFFDSLTSENSVCREAARAAGVKYARRDIFLDIPNDPATIEKRILGMRKVAFNKGSATAIGHYRHNTIAALKKYMPAMAAEGVKFVFISDFEK
jgi:polysaccharide deacetylase 2 family uncharacterized protein YibQ